MRLTKFRPLLVAVAATLASTAQAQTLADWDFSSLVNPGVPNAPTANPLISSADANAGAGVTASDLVAVIGQPTYAGLLWAVSSTNGEMNHKYWDGDSTDISGTGHDGVSDNWISFTLTNTQGCAIDVGRLSVSAWRNGAGAPGRYSFEVVVDGGMAQSFAASQDDPDAGDSIYDWFHFDDSVSFFSTLEVRFQAVAIPGGLGTGNLHVNGLQVMQDGLGTSYCTATANSTTFAASISATGSTSVAQNDFTLSACSVPDQFGVFYYGQSQENLPFGNGVRCVGGTVVRLPIITPSNNAVTYGVDLAAEGIVAGTYDFQYWFRDPASGGAFFDLSNGIEVVFVP